MADSVSKKILIVDDTIANLRLLVDTLSQYNYEIIVARSGEEALRIAESSVPDLILLDVMMPEMDGFETCFCLKLSPKTANIPVVFLSALDDSASKIRGFSAGGVDYISKPFQEEEVIARVHTHLSLSQTRQELESTVKKLQISDESRKRSEEHLKTILNALPQAVAYLDSDFQIQYANHSFLSMFRFDDSDVSVCTFDHIPPESAVLINHIIKNHKNNGNKPPEIGIPDHDGSSRFFEYQIISDESNFSLPGFFLVLTDISRHKREEAAITNLKEQLEIVLNSIDSIIYVSDMDTHEILYLNEKAKMEFGQCIGEVCYKVLQSGHCEPCSFCTNDKLLDTSGQPIGVYSWDYQNSINNRWYHCQDVAIPWLDGRYVRLEIATDLTEKKVHERALQQANEKLNLLSGITRHDVLNQLTVLTNLIEMQQEMPLDSKHLNLIAREKDACETINHLIQFTREYEDLGMYDPRWMNLGECLTMHQGECQSLTIHYSPNIWNYAILGDPLISKVFYNLLDNTKRHGGSVQKVTYSVDQIQDNLILLYEDDGVGIPSDMKELIFEKGVGKNTGLGLFFCREVLALTGIMIREFGGGIHGARFELVVPKKSWRYTPHLSE